MGRRPESVWNFLAPFEKNWLREVPFSDAALPWHETCELKRATKPEHWKASWKRIPPGLASFWSVYREAVLFKNVEYGQWGLHLLPPAKAKKATSRNHKFCLGLKPGDIVLGEFFGDLNALVIDQLGRVFFAEPLDDRSDWYRHRGGLRSFLREYVKHEGQWFWAGRRATGSTR